MTMMATILLVGAGSYALRVIPLLFVDKVKLSARTEELLGYAALAAMTALLVATIRHLAEQQPMPGVPLVAPWIALAAGAVAAALRQSMGRVLAVGMAAYATTALLPALW